MSLGFGVTKIKTDTAGACCQKSGHNQGIKKVQFIPVNLTLSTWTMSFQSVNFFRDLFLFFQIFAVCWLLRWKWILFLFLSIPTFKFCLKTIFVCPPSFLPAHSNHYSESVPNVATNLILTWTRTELFGWAGWSGWGNWIFREMKIFSNIRKYHWKKESSSQFDFCQLMTFN